MMQKKIIVCWLLFVGLVLISVESIAGQKVLQKGVASVPEDAKSVDIASLRQQAIKNALDLAVLQVTGAQISSQKSGTTRTKETTVIHNGDQENSTSEQNRYSTAVKTRTEGHARLVKINREWLDGALYHVEAVFDVDTPEELLSRKNAGYYWNKAGRPSLGLFFQNEVNGQFEDVSECNTLQFLRENLTRNDLATSEPYHKSRYLIKAHQQVTYRESEMGTVTVNCRLSFQFVDQVKNETIAEFRRANGPVAGFSIEQATDNCLKEIAPAVSENLIRTIATTMNDHWNNGTGFNIVIDHVSGNYVPRITEILNNLFQVTNTFPPKYSNGSYTQAIKYKGSGAELSQAIQDAFGDEDWTVEVRHINEQDIQFYWTTAK